MRAGRTKDGGWHGLNEARKRGEGTAAHPYYARTQYVHVVRDDYGGSAYTHRNAITTSSLPLPSTTDAPTKTLNIDLWDANLGGGGSETLQWLPNSRPSG